MINISGFDVKYPKNIEFLKIDIPDSDDANILEHFQPCFEFIEKSIKNEKNCLIHCQSAVSRSVSIVTSYLIKSKNINVNQALEIIQNKCFWMIEPNDGFIKQLKQWHANHIAQSKK